MQPGGETVVEVEGEVGVVGGYSEPGSLKQMKDSNWEKNGGNAQTEPM